MNNYTSLHPTSSFLPPDSHELQPLHSFHGISDTSTISRRNGVLNRNTTLTNYNGRFKQFESGCDQFDGLSEPSEIDSLLPVRSCDGHLPKFNLDTNSTGASAGGMGKMWMRTTPIVNEKPVQGSMKIKQIFNY